MRLAKAVSRTTRALTLAGVGLALFVASNPANAARDGWSSEGSKIHREGAT